MQWIRREITIGLVGVTLAHQSGTDETHDEEAYALARRQIEALEKCLRGIATPEERRLFIELLNGPTMDEMLDRPKAVIPANPCGCKGK